MTRLDYNKNSNNDDNSYYHNSSVLQQKEAIMEVGMMIVMTTYHPYQVKLFQSKIEMSKYK